MNLRKHYLYDTYYNMVMRCRSTVRPNSKWYSLKGISVCARRCPKRNGRGVGFRNFLEDMGDRPTNYQLDRIDNNGNYTPENCRWVSKYEQMANISSNNRDVGVGWHKQRGKWRARIKVDGKDISLGLYDNYEDAVNARKKGFNIHS